MGGTIVSFVSTYDYDSSTVVVQCNIFYQTTYRCHVSKRDIHAIHGVRLGLIDGGRFGLAAAAF